jgi:protein-disulfide isomerase
MTLALRAAFALALALSLAGCKQADEAFGKKVHAYLMAHPEVIEEAAQKLQQNRAAQADTAARQAIPKHRAELERDPRDFVANPDGKLTVVEFFDYRCGYCKLAAPEVLKIIENNPDVRFVFKEMPIFGDVSDRAAKIALTQAGKGQGLALYQGWMAEKALDDAAIDRHLRNAGLDPAETRKAADAPEIARQIADVHALATALKIEGTPAFVVGDVMIPGADMDALRTAITKAKAVDLKKPG